MSDRTQEMHRDAPGHVLPVHQQIGDVVRQISSSFDGGLVHTIFHHCRFKHRSHSERLADDTLLPRRKFAIGVEAGAHGVIGARTIKPAAYVILARPDDLDRLLDGFGGLDSFQNEMTVEHSAPSEATAEQRGV